MEHRTAEHETDSRPAAGGRPANAEPAPPAEAFTTAAPPGKAKKKRRKTLFEWVEGKVSALSARNNFWHRIASYIWLPYAFRSGIRMRRVTDGEETSFTAVLPFKRFNRNWYNAMAGASLLANSEIAGGMYVFARAGEDYTVVCKELSYRFLRPCYGPAVYQVLPKTDLDRDLAHGGEFNVELTLNVYQQLKAPGQGKEKRVGRVKAVFHVTPKAHHREKKARAAAVAPEPPGAPGAVAGPGVARSGSS